jgi:hypothetical protein
LLIELGGGKVRAAGQSEAVKSGVVASAGLATTAADKVIEAAPDMISLRLSEPCFALKLPLHYIKEPLCSIIIGKIICKAIHPCRRPTFL